MMTTLRTWTPRHWLTAVGGGVAVALLVAVPTAVIPNPVFGRSVAVTWWSVPVVAVTGILSGLILASYVPRGRDAGGSSTPPTADRPSRFGMAGTLASLFAVGCPVCNKLVLLALGSSGAMTWFAPVQPVLAVISTGLLAVALAQRLRRRQGCAIPQVTGDRPA